VGVPTGLFLLRISPFEILQFIHARRAFHFTRVGDRFHRSGCDRLAAFVNPFGDLVVPGCDDRFVTPACDDGWSSRRMCRALMGWDKDDLNGSTG
jgi:hypothetical protein